MPEVDVERICFPLYLVKREPAGGLPIHFYGTCFILPGGLVITCKHCLDLNEQEEGTFVGIMEDSSGNQIAHPLFDMSHDPSGADLASARVNWELSSPIHLADGVSGVGYNVATFGFSDTYGELDETTGKKNFHQHNRFGRGYISRDFIYTNPNDRKDSWRMWEVDLPSPVGNSGSPLLWVKDGAVMPILLGVISGNHPERRESRDGVIIPPYVFGLAEHSSTLNALRGQALGGKTLLEYMTDRDRVTRERSG